MVKEALYHISAGISESIAIKLASSIDDVLWLSAFLTPNLSKHELIHNSLVYGLVCLFQTCLAYGISTFGEEAVDKLIPHGKISTDKLLTLIAGSAMFLYGIYLGIEYYREEILGDDDDDIDNDDNNDEKGGGDKNNGDYKSLSVGNDNGNYKGGVPISSSEDVESGGGETATTTTKMTLTPLSDEKVPHPSPKRTKNGYLKVLPTGDGDDATIIKESVFSKFTIDDDNEDGDSNVGDDDVTYQNTFHDARDDTDIEEDDTSSFSSSLSSPTSSSSRISSLEIEQGNDVKVIKEEQHNTTVVNEQECDITHENHAANDHQQQKQHKSSQSLAIIAFLGSLDDLALFVPMLVGKAVGIIELIIGATVSIAIIVLLCLFLTKCKMISDILQRIPLVVIVIIFATFLLTKGMFMD